MTDGQTAPEPFDLNAVKTRHGLARFGKDRELSTALLLNNDLPRVWVFLAELQGALIRAAMERHEQRANSDRILALLIGATAAAGGELVLPWEVINGAGESELALENGAEAVTLRLVARPREGGPIGEEEPVPDALDPPADLVAAPVAGPAAPPGLRSRRRKPAAARSRDDVPPLP